MSALDKSVRNDLQMQFNYSQGQICVHVVIVVVVLFYPQMSQCLLTPLAIHLHVYSHLSPATSVKLQMRPPRTQKDVEDKMYPLFAQSRRAECFYFGCEVHFLNCKILFWGKKV